MVDVSSKLGKIFIGGLSYETTDEKLRSYFSAFGPVTDAVVMKDPISRRSRGFGFITYADPICVDRALAQPNHILDSRKVEAKRAVPRAESTSRDSMSSTSSRNGSVISTTSTTSTVGSTKKIFVGGLHYETKDAEFRRYFQQYGKVASAEVMFNRETNKSRGFGFVIFESEESVEYVLHETNHVIDGKAVEVKRAVPRTDIPPTRSVSSRAGSFSGTLGGPGSVGSLDDLSVGSTASMSRAGTASSSLSASGISLSDQPRGSTLGGYAAAVRYGSRGLPKSSGNGVGSYLDAHDDPEKTLASVADALTSLVLDEDSTSTPVAVNASRKPAVLESPAAPFLSPLGITPTPLADPMSDGWKLASPLVPETSASDPSTVDNNGEWQTRPWQKGWQARAQEDPLATTPSYFSAFAGPDRRGSATASIGQDTWSSSTYSTSIPPPATSSIETSGSFGSNGHRNGGFGGGFRSRPAYSTLAAFFPPEYLATPAQSLADPTLPLDAPLGAVSDDFEAVSAGNVESRKAPFHRQFR